MTEQTRSPEHMHTKRCLAAAMISAIENFRDAEYLTDHDFRLAAQDNEVLNAADNYLADELQDCRCGECQQRCCTVPTLLSGLDRDFTYAGLIQHDDGSWNQFAILSGQTAADIVHGSDDPARLRFELL